jgi:hypothetical protein
MTLDDDQIDTENSGAEITDASDRRPRPRDPATSRTIDNVISSAHRAMAAAPAENKLRIFEFHCRELFGYVRNGIVEKAEIVDALQAMAEEAGLDAICGNDTITSIMVEAAEDGTVHETATRTADGKVVSLADARNRRGAGKAPATAEEADAAIARLSKMESLDYQRFRRSEAARLGMQVAYIDDAVRKRRAGSADGDNQEHGNQLDLKTPEAWPEPVDGEKLLNEIAATIRSYVVMPERECYIVTLWAVHTFIFERFRTTPRLAILAPEKNCGKSTLMDALGCLVCRPLKVDNTTVSPYFRIIEKSKPTLLLDEGDSYMDKKEMQELRGIINSGHKSNGAVLRTVGKDLEPKLFSTFAPCAIARIGDLWDTVRDRSVVVELQRKRATDVVSDLPDDPADLKTLGRKIVRWTTDHLNSSALLVPKCRPGSTTGAATTGASFSL